MSLICTLGASSAFCAGGAVALLISYPIPAHSIFVCFIALLVGLLACVLAAGALIFHAVRRERVCVDRVIDLTVDELLRRRGLEAVDRFD